MTKLTKTEQKLLDRLEQKKYTGYDGPREANAARKLEEKGLIKRRPVDGHYWVRRQNGDYVRRYWPQGTIQKI